MLSHQKFDKSFVFINFLITFEASLDEINYKPSFFFINKLKIYQQTNNLMKKFYSLITLLLLGALNLCAQSVSPIYQPGTEGPWYQEKVEQGKPRNFYDYGGPEKGTKGDFAYTLMRLEPGNSDSHITIVFEKMNLAKYDDLRIYDGLVELYCDRTDEATWGWPKDKTEIKRFKGEENKMPVRVSSTSKDGCLSVAFYSADVAEGWVAKVYCVPNGGEEPTVGTAEVVPNFTLKVDPKLETKLDEDGEEIPNEVTLQLGGIQANQTIQIDVDGTKKDYTILKKGLPNNVNLEVSANSVIKIYGDLYSLAAQCQKLVACDLGKNDQLEDLDLTGNKITALDLSKSPKMRILSVTANKLTSIDLSNLANLEQFYGSYNVVGALRTKMNPKLEVLSCAGMGLKELDLTSNPNLEILTIDENKFEVFPDLTNKPNLRYLHMEKCDLKNIDVTIYPLLKDLDVSDNQLSTIDITKNPKLIKLDLDNNKFDACTLNDVMYLLPKANESDQARFQADGNDGSATCDKTLLDGKNYFVKVQGNGGGCDKVRLKFEANTQGSIKTKVDGNNVAEWTPIVKGKKVEIEATPMQGYKLEKTMLDGKTIENNTFTINNYGVLAAVFTKTDGIDKVETENLKVISHNGNIIVKGLQAEKTFAIFDTAGKLLHKGVADANGDVTISMPSGHIAILRQGRVAIKIAY